MPLVLVPGILDEKDVRVPGVHRVEALVSEVLAAVRQRRVEMAHEAALVRNGNLPDAEESEDMVDAEGIEVLRHLAHPRLPPGEAVLLHFLPVIGRESPVLTVRGEGIRRGAGLAVHVEEFRMLPGIHAHAGNTDGKVSLDGDAMQVGISHRFLELFVQQVLQEAVEIHLGRVLLREFQGFPPVVTAPFPPGGEIGRSMAVPEHAEHGIREQPLLVGVHERLVLGGGAGLLSLGALEELPQETQFRLRDRLVIHGRKGFQFLFPGLVGRILADAGIRQVDVHRMQRKGAHGIVRIGILPGMGHRGVVDRKELDDALPGRHGPVHQLLDIMELTHAEAVLRTEREHRDGHAGSPPGTGEELRVDVGHHHMAAGRGNFTEEMVRTLFPDKGTAGFRVHDDELVFEGVLHIQVQLPVREAAVVQEMEFLPVAEGFPAARQGDGFPGTHLGDGHAESHVPLHRSGRTRMPEGGAVVAAEDHVAEGVGIEGGIHRTVGPALADHLGLRLFGSAVQVRTPFGADRLSVPQHLEGIAVAVAEVPAGQFRLPHAGEGRLHRITSFPHPDDEALPPGGMVMKDDSDVHIAVLVIVPFAKQK